MPDMKHAVWAALGTQGPASRMCTVQPRPIKEEKNAAGEVTARTYEKSTVDLWHGGYSRPYAFHLSFNDMKAATKATLGGDASGNAPTFFPFDRDHEIVTHQFYTFDCPAIVAVQKNADGSIGGIQPASYVEKFCLAAIPEATLVVGTVEPYTLHNIAVALDDAFEHAPGDRYGRISGCYGAGPDADAKRAADSRVSKQRIIDMPWPFSKAATEALVLASFGFLPVGIKTTFAEAADLVDTVPPGYAVYTCPSGASDDDILAGRAAIAPFTNASVTITSKALGIHCEDYERELLENEEGRMNQFWEQQVYGPIDCGDKVACAAINPGFWNVASVYRIFIRPSGSKTLDFHVGTETLASANIKVDKLPIYGTSDLSGAFLRTMVPKILNSGRPDDDEAIYELSASLNNEGVEFLGGINGQRLKKFNLSLIPAVGAGWEMFVCARTMNQLFYENGSVRRALAI